MPHLAIREHSAMVAAERARDERRDDFAVECSLRRLFIVHASKVETPPAMFAAGRHDPDVGRHVVLRARNDRDMIVGFLRQEERPTPEHDSHVHIGSLVIAAGAAVGIAIGFMIRATDAARTTTLAANGQRRPKRAAARLHGVGREPLAKCLELGAEERRAAGSEKVGTVALFRYRTR